MVSKSSFHISRIWGAISIVLISLIGLFQNEVRNLITSVFGVSNEVFVFYAIIVLLIIGISLSIIILIYGWKTKPNQIIRDLDDFLDRVIITLEINISS